MANTSSSGTLTKKHLIGYALGGMGSLLGSLMPLVLFPLLLSYFKDN